MMGLSWQGAGPTTSSSSSSQQRSKQWSLNKIMNKAGWLDGGQGSCTFWLAFLLLSHILWGVDSPCSSALQLLPLGS